MIKNRTKKNQIILRVLALSSFVLLLLELFGDNMEAVNAFMLLASSVAFFIESDYPDIYEDDSDQILPLDKDFLLFVCNAVFIISLITKFVM